MQQKCVSRSAGAEVVVLVPTALLWCPGHFRTLAIKALITAPSSVPSSWRQLSQLPGRPLGKHARGRPFRRRPAAMAAGWFQLVLMEHLRWCHCSWT